MKFNIGRGVLLIAAVFTLTAVNHVYVSDRAFSPAIADEQEKIALLHNAIRHKDVESVKQLLKDGSDPNGVHQNFTPLSAAFEYPSLEIVSLLLSYGADPNARSTSYGVPLLIYAATNMFNNPNEFAKALIKHNANVNVKDSKGITALVYAVKRKNQELVDVLLAAGADAYAHNEKSNSFYTQPAIVDSETLQSVSSLQDDQDEIQPEFVKRQKAFEDNLRKAAHSGDLGWVEKILLEDININSKDKFGKTALHYAAGSGRDKIVALLLKSGASPVVTDEGKSSPLDLAIRSEYKNVFDILIKENYGSGGIESALVEATKVGKLDVLNKLLEKSELLSDKQFSSPFIVAIRNGHRRVSEILLPFVDDKQSLLDVALTKVTDTTMLKWLLKNGANVNSSDSFGESVLFKLVSTGRCDLVAVLSNSGAQSSGSEKARSRTSPIEYAIYKKQPTITRLLMNNLGDFNPLDYGRDHLLIQGFKSGNYHIAREISEHYGDSDISKFQNSLSTILKNNSDENLINLVAKRFAPAEENTIGISQRGHLIRAVKSGKVELVRKTIDQGVHPDVRKSGQKTALMIAAQEGHFDILKYFLGAGAGSKYFRW